MRVLLMIFGLVVVACIGWNAPFCDTARTLFPWAQIPPSRLSVIKARAAATPAAGEQRVVEPRRPFQSNSPLTQPARH